MPSFLQAVSCGLIGSTQDSSPEGQDAHHHNRSTSLRRLGNKHENDNDLQNTPRISSLRSSSSINHNDNDPHTSRKRSSKRMSGQGIVSRLSRRHRKSKSLSNGAHPHSEAVAADTHPATRSLLGITGEDFRIRDEDIAIPSVRASYAASFSSSTMTKPHTSITNTSTAFQDCEGSVPAIPAMPSHLQSEQNHDMSYPHSEAEHNTGNHTPTNRSGLHGAPSAALHHNESQGGAENGALPQMSTHPVKAFNTGSTTATNVSTGTTGTSKTIAESSSPLKQVANFISLHAHHYESPTAVNHSEDCDNSVMPHSPPDRVANRSLVVDTSLDRNFGF